MSDDPIDDLLDQATACAQKLLLQRSGATDDDGNDGNSSTEEEDLSSIFNFTYPNTTSADDILSGKHDLIEVRDCNDKNGDDSGSQRGVYAKCDIMAGTRLVVSTPIVVCWDVEDEDDEVDEGNELDVEDGDDGDEVEYQEVDNVEIDGKMEASSDYNLKASQEDGNSSVLDDSDDNNSDQEEEQSPGGTKRNGILILRTLEKIKQSPSLWTNTLSKLYPRNTDMALSLPPWFCSDASIGIQIETQFANLPSLNLFSAKENKDVCEEIVLRLPLIVRYNVLSIETCSEMFVYPDVTRGGLVGLAGTGLYGPEVSYFNHSCVPNVSRYCIGNVMFFVTNRKIAKGDELCFSYIEHEYLCESAKRRSALLDMDFELNDDDHENSKGDQRPSKRQKVAKMPTAKEEDHDQQHYPLIDSEMQSELMATPPTERLDLINELLEQKIDPSQGDFQCDKYQLRILKALTLDGLGQASVALPEWESALDFAVKTFPPLDETTIALHVQAALCAWNASREKNGNGSDNGNKNKKAAKKKARYHADKALTMHNSLFGGEEQRFFKRYEKEFLCPLRPVKEPMDAVRELFFSDGDASKMPKKKQKKKN